jgi:hypothetical protein
MYKDSTTILLCSERSIMSLDSTILPIFEPAKPPPPGEFTLEQLQNHLQTAIYVEMSTIPLYLYAYYSIKPGGQGDKSRQSILRRSSLASL